MERLTYRSTKFNNPVSYGACEKIKCSAKCDSCKINDLIAKLCAYEETGLEPEEINDMALEVATLKTIESMYDGLGNPDHLRDLLQAEQDGRLVVLDEPQKPLVWGDDNHDTILCPTCKHDLMGGFQEADSCEAPMYQCPYCGQPIDGRKALTREEAEAALSGKAVTPNG